MSFVDKMKKLFLEEEEEALKSEVIQVEIPAPAKEVIKEEPEEVLKEPVKEVYKEERQAPIFFDDNYFRELEKPKPEVRSTYKKEIKKIDDVKFKPTPIISPVYGVLDKNYSKEDIVEKGELDSYNIKSGITIDDVRKKAYGTLEDELESDLYSANFAKSTVPKEEFFEELIDIEEPYSEGELLNLIDIMYENGGNKDGY